MTNLSSSANILPFSFNLKQMKPRNITIRIYTELCVLSSDIGLVKTLKRIPTTPEFLHIIQMVPNDLYYRFTPFTKTQPHFARLIGHTDLWIVSFLYRCQSPDEDTFPNRDFLEEHPQVCVDVIYPIKICIDTCALPFNKICY